MNPANRRVIFKIGSLETTLFKKIKPDFIMDLTKSSKSVVQGDDDDLAVSGQDGAVVGVSRVPFVRLAVDKHDHWQSLSPVWKTQTAGRSVVGKCHRSDQVTDNQRQH